MNEKIKCVWLHIVEYVQIVEIGLIAINRKFNIRIAIDVDKSISCLKVQ